MKTDIILRAMEVLRDADQFLMAHPNPGGVVLSGRCFDARMDLRLALLKNLPEIEIEAEAK